MTLTLSSCFASLVEGHSAIVSTDHVRRDQICVGDCLVIVFSVLAYSSLLSDRPRCRQMCSNLQMMMTGQLNE